MKNSTVGIEVTSPFIFITGCSIKLLSCGPHHCWYDTIPSFKDNDILNSLYKHLLKKYFFNEKTIKCNLSPKFIIFAWIRIKFLNKNLVRKQKNLKKVINSGSFHAGMRFSREHWFKPKENIVIIIKTVM